MKNYHPHRKEMVVKVRSYLNEVRNGWYRVHECKLDDSLTLTPATDEERSRAELWQRQVGVEW